MNAPHGEPELAAGWASQLINSDPAGCPPPADHGHGFMPSYVYRQLTEFYHRQDFILDKRQLDQLIG